MNPIDRLNYWRQLVRWPALILDELRAIRAELELARCEQGRTA